MAEASEKQLMGTVSDAEKIVKRNLGRKRKQEKSIYFQVKKLYILTDKICIITLFSDISPICSLNQRYIVSVFWEVVLPSALHFR